MSDNSYETVVVGVGGMGSATLYHLAKRGVKVLGIEQFDIAHDRGSSHGLSRIIRLAYQEHPSYVPLLKRSYELWQQLQQETGMDILAITGGLDISVQDSAQRDGTSFKGALLAAQTHQLEHEVLSGRQVNQRWPGYGLPDDCKALYQPQGGILASEHCIQAHVAAARGHGAELHTNERVLRWSAGAHGGAVEVVTDRGVYSADRLVLTAGAWMPQLLPALQGVCQPERQVVGWFSVSEPAAFTRSSFPIFILDDSQGVYYGFPSYDHPGFKIGKMHHRRQQAQPDALDRDITPLDEQTLRRAVAKYFPLANGPMTKAAACMFTNSPDESFIIDLHPAHKQVVICSACSGHGFKFCSVIGEILADLAMQGSTKHDIALHRISRLPGFHSSL